MRHWYVPSLITINSTLRVRTRSMHSLSDDEEMRVSTLKNDQMKKRKNVYMICWLWKIWPPSAGEGFAREGARTCIIEEYQYVNMKPLFPPISIQIQFENSAKKMSGADLIWLLLMGLSASDVPDVTCSCLLRTYWSGEEAGVHTFRSFIWKWKDHSCREQNALLPCKPMSKLFPFQLATTNFFQTIVRRWFDLSFRSGSFSLRLLLCNKKFQLTFLNMTNSWCIIGQGRRLRFTASRVSYNKERTTHARNRMLFCHFIHLVNCCHFNWQLQFSSRKWSGDYLNWVL